jgi:hypothetical protein
MDIPKRLSAVTCAISPVPCETQARSGQVCESCRDDEHDLDGLGRSRRRPRSRGPELRARRSHPAVGGRAHVARIRMGGRPDGRPGRRARGRAPCQGVPHASRRRPVSPAPARGGRRLEVARNRPPRDQGPARRAGRIAVPTLERPGPPLAIEGKRAAARSVFWFSTGLKPPHTAAQSLPTSPHGGERGANIACSVQRRQAAASSADSALQRRFVVE